MPQTRIETLQRELAALREELMTLKNRTGELERRLARLEVKEQLAESPDAAGDNAVKYG